MNPIVSSQVSIDVMYVFHYSCVALKVLPDFFFGLESLPYMWETFSRNYIFYSFGLLSTFFLSFRTGEFGIIWLFKQCLLTRKVLIVLSKTKMSFRFFPHLLSRISCKPQDLSISSVILTAASSIFLECSLFGYFFTFKIFFSFY